MSLGLGMRIGLSVLAMRRAATGGGAPVADWVDESGNNWVDESANLWMLT